MPLRITTVSENSVAMGIGLKAEHGLGYYIEKDGLRIFFDTGQGLVFEDNLKAMGIPISGISHMVLSHGHYDHAGALRAVVENNPEIKIIAHPDAFKPKYLSYDNQSFHYIGINPKISELENLGASLVLSTESVEIAPGVMTTGEIPMVCDFEKGEPYFFKDSGNEKIHDDISDDQSMVIETEKGLVVVLGCTHRGLINTLTHIAEMTGKNKFHAITGGLHLGGAKEDRLKKTADALKAFDIDRLIVGHCTGMNSAVYLHNALPGKVEFGCVGFTILV